MVSKMIRSSSHLQRCCQPPSGVLLRRNPVGNDGCYGMCKKALAHKQPLVVTMIVAMLLVAGACRHWRGWLSKKIQLC